MKTFFQKIILVACLVSLMPVWSFAQISYVKGDEKSVIKEFPKYKGVEYQLAITDYIKYFFRNNDLKNRSNKLYTPVFSFCFNEKGSLLGVNVVQSTGSVVLDSKLQNICKDFTRKKFMSPAFSEEGPIACVLEVQLEFVYPIMKDFKKDNLGYREYYYMGYIPYYSAHEYGNNAFKGSIPKK